MKLRVQGQDYTGFTTLQVSRHFLNACGHFMFTASPKNIQNNSYPIQRGQNVQVIVEDQVFLNGYIEQVSISTTASSVVIAVQGRDKTCDLVDSTIWANIFTTYIGPVSLETICRTILDKLNMSGIGVVDNVGVFFAQGDFIAPTTAENAFEFLERYAQKGQVILTTDGKGNLLIDRGGTELLFTQLLLTFDGQNNNILTGMAVADSSKRYNLYKVYSQYFNLIGPIDQESASLNDAIVNSQGTVADPEIRVSRQLVFIPDTPVSGQTAIDRATWEANYRKTEGFSYTCTVSGHTYDGVNIWPLNKLVQVIDDFANINSPLLIDTVTFSESVKGGLTTELRLVPPDSYQLQIEEDYRKEESRERTNAYFRSGQNAQ